jgi:toxic protein SymE
MKVAKTTRVVKLHCKYRASASGWQGCKEVPWLSVDGLWLEQAGFKAGDQVEITVTSNQLIIKNLLCDGATRD